MTYRENMQLWVREALGQLGGQGEIIAVAKQLWAAHESDLKADDHFFTWQYDMRWAAQELRRQGKLGLRKEGSKSVWVLR